MAGLDNQSLTLPKEGIPLIDFAYSKYGTNTVGLTIFTNNDLIKDNPDLVRRFVKATVRSFEAAMKDPEASIKAGQKVKPDLETALSLAQLKVGIGLMKTEATRETADRLLRGQGLGRYARTDEEIHGAGNIDEGVGVLHQRVSAEIVDRRRTTRAGLASPSTCLDGVIAGRSGAH